MDIGKVAFPPRLLEILEALSESHFVSIDFEFSGVATKPTVRQKQTLQERYVETKEAAEKYQILQVGLTCVVQDEAKEAYTLQPFNIPISPLFEEDLDLERQFSFQTGAVEFLLNNAFDFNLSFEQGVPYLSRDEEQLAKDKFEARDDKSRFEDIVVADNDTLNMAYMEKVRVEIKDWLDRGKNESVEILSRTVHWKNCKHEGDLTGFDKRLIHQLVRNEFAELVTISRRQSILIKKMDVERELKIRKDKYKRLKKKIYVQTGFRWVIEAMTGGPLSQIDLTWFARNPDTGAPSYYDNVACEARFHRACDKLKRKRPVLVGHNCFTDLIYLYSTFIGKLPETVGEFGLRIHDLFPVIVDTKYMFTHNCGNLNPASSLDSIEESLRTQQTPRIETHKDHGKYLTDELYHEAGYDSYLTARVMILLSTKLGAAGTYVPDDSSRNPPPLTPNEEHKLTASPPPTPQQQDSGGSFVDVRLSVGKVNKSSPRSPNGHSSKQSPAIRTKSRSRFATKTLFEALASSSPSENDNDNDNDDEQAISATVLGSSFALNPAARPFPVVSTGHAAVDANTVTGGPSRKGKEKRKELKPDALMPPFSSDFWSIYANKLRVFGTVKGMLELDPVRL